MRCLRAILHVHYLSLSLPEVDGCVVGVGVLQEALEERYHMLNAAPYMNHPLPIMLPLYE